MDFYHIHLGALCKKSLSKYEFFENQLGDNHTLRKGINEFLPVFSTFLDLGEVWNIIYPHSAI
jgi:hypothetical protein